MRKSSDKRPITSTIFQHLVSLAALDLDEEEAVYLLGELNDQLQAISDLEAIGLPEDIDITSHGVPYTPESRQAAREDEIRPSEKADAILNQAPEVEDRYIVVPDLPRTELE